MSRPKDAALIDNGVCPVCGKRRFRSRRQAKRAARTIYPADRFRVYPCGDAYHFGHNAHRQSKEGIVPDPDALFDLPEGADPVPRPAKESPTVRRTKRQAALLAVGSHPLSAVLSRRLPLHPEAAPVGDDRQAEGRRCGNCAFRQALHSGARSYPKCLAGWQEGSRHPPPRATHSEASDVRAWWPACRDHEWEEDNAH
ncbi:hypothetical protein Ssi03_62290 [Sphaerisporangium siamense]|uniref:Uncharacterized protein n=1 Tax=Sphaerisporangium siamense TaxID=795645 RepID=A0A7W7D956_9ACTN|nr:hypothetical protein [Sphaerisporangium siamense]MBB4702540.1 hypothetical protein [Sphaerisporangium siamense]GII88239.1 hypothetical protein Ssi03_62290 [Sphaerisporangium siamense]